MAPQHPTSRLADLAWISALWIVLVLLVWPAGDFPLNDDWSYAAAVRSLVEGGELELTGWTSMPLVAQVWLGGAVCKVFGFSFEALRLLSIVLGWLGLLATYALLREVGLDSAPARLGTILVAANPIYLNLACTFMTDVPFYAAAMGSLWWFARGLARESGASVALGTAAAGFATLIRQLGLAIPVAWALAAVLRARGARRGGADWLVALGPALLVGAVFVAFNVWLRGSHGVPELYWQKSSELARILTQEPVRFLARWPARLLAVFVYLGVFLFPVLVLVGRGGLRRRWPWVTVVTAGLLAGLAAGGKRMPLFGNVLFDLGVGPVTLRDPFIVSSGAWPQAPELLWWAVTAAGAFGAAMILVGSWRIARRNGRLSPRFWLVVGFSVVYMLPFSASNAFDRYLLPMLPPVLAAVFLGGHRWPAGRGARAWMVAWLLASAAIAVAGTRDYFAWNRARWAALDEAALAGVSPARIDGGFEFNGLHLYRESFTPPEERSWWWVEDDEYVVSLAPQAGYTEVGRHPFRRWLPPGRGHVLLLRRTETRSGEATAE